MFNYRHLFYFWNVAKLGGVHRAAERLNLTPQTVSGQLGEFQRSMGVDLMRRSGRKLELTQAGKFAMSHAEKIFQLGEELEQSLRNLPMAHALLFSVGVMDAVPKSMAYRLLQPAFEVDKPVHLVCHEDKHSVLFAELAIKKLDLVIADRPLPRELGIQGFNHELGRSGVMFLGCGAMAESLSQGFPDTLNGAGMLLPREGASLRGALNNWFAKRRIHPNVMGEFDDTALLKAFGQAGVGVFPVPSVIAEEVERKYNVERIGEAADAVVKYYAVSRERTLKHPCVVAVHRMAGSTFAPQRDGRRD